MVFNFVSHWNRGLAKIGNDLFNEYLFLLSVTFSPLISLVKDIEGDPSFIHPRWIQKQLLVLLIEFECGHLVMDLFVS